MSWRYHGKASVDPSNPRAFAICDRCGGLRNHSDLTWELQYNGTGLYRTGFLVCQPCLDIPQPQLLNPILPPDPMPVMNARPEPYFLDEVDILSTQVPEGIETQSELDIVTNQPSQNFSD